MLWLLVQFFIVDVLWLRWDWIGLLPQLPIHKERVTCAVGKIDSQIANQPRADRPDYESVL